VQKCILFAPMVVALFLSACAVIPGAGNVVTREETFTDFDKVDVSDAFHVGISQGDTFSVVLRIDENVVRYLEVVKEGSTLKIGLKPAAIGIGLRTLEAEVTMPELTRLDLGGASHGSITGFKSTKGLHVDVSGASHLTGDIEAGDAGFDVSGASHVTLTGSGEDVTIDASGASHVDLADFPVADASVEASGASHVTVNPSGRLDVGAGGASHVYYLGSPTLGTVNADDSSSVEHR
jgi:hypothetical protein